MEDRRVTPHKGPIHLTPSQVIHEARMWLESEGLGDDIPDPYSPRHIVMLMQSNYPKGFGGFAHDLKTVPIRRCVQERYRAGLIK